MIARELLGLPIWATEVQQGLRRSPKSLPSKLFYDAAGSALFDRITRLPEYYLTRTELQILHRESSAIARTVGPGATLIELGAGSAAKTCTLLQAFARIQLAITYYAVDISSAALATARATIESQCPSTRFRAVIADLNQGFDFLGEIPGRRLVAYLGSSIGNFDPPGATGLLRELRARLRHGDALLLGTDMVKDENALLSAYNDSAGVTAAFNKNMLARLNRELGADFDLERFTHLAFFNSARSRIEMHLESVCRQSVRLGALGETVTFRRGERIHTENSYKYTRATVDEMLGSGGFLPSTAWADSRDWFALTLASVASGSPE